MIIEHQSEFNTRFILVDYYRNSNEICFYGFDFKENLNNCKDHYSIGVWHVKPKKQKV